MIRSFKAVSIYIFKSSVPLRLTEQPEKPIRQFNRSPVPIVFTGEREADRQTPALADYCERDGRPPVAVDESPEVGAREGRAVDGLDHVAGAQSARGARAVGSDGDDEQAAARPEARSAARVQPDCVKAEGLQRARGGVPARGPRARLIRVVHSVDAGRRDASLGCLDLLLNFIQAKLRLPQALGESSQRGCVRGALLLRPHVLDFAAQGRETRARRALLGLRGRERGVLRALQLDCELERRYRGRAPHREVERGADAGLLEREREVFDAPHVARADARDNVACAQARERGGSPRRDRGQEHSLPPLYVRERRLRLPAEADPRFERGLKGLEAAEAEPRLRRARAELEHALARSPHRLDRHDLRLARTALRNYADDLARLVP